jgi:hypothetical protein
VRKKEKQRKRGKREEKKERKKRDGKKERDKKGERKERERNRKERREKGKEKEKERERERKKERKRERDKTRRHFKSYTQYVPQINPITVHGSSSDRHFDKVRSSYLIIPNSCVPYEDQSKNSGNFSIKKSFP